MSVGAESTEYSEPSDHFSHNGVAGSGCIVAVSNALVDLGQGRIRRYPAHHSLNFHFLRDRKRPHLNELTGMLADNRCSEDFAIFGNDHLDQPISGPLGLGAIVFMVRRVT